MNHANHNTLHELRQNLIAAAIVLVVITAGSSVIMTLCG